MHNHEEPSYVIGSTGTKLKNGFSLHNIPIFDLYKKIALKREYAHKLLQE